MKNFLLLIALLAPAIAQADWVKLVSAGEGEVIVYVDPGSIKREGNVVEFSTLFDYATVRNLSGAPFQSATMQDEIDCAGKRNRTLAVTSHSEPMAGGHIVSLTSPRSGRQSVGGSADSMLSRHDASRKDKEPSRS
jgi:hypothetical protein